MAFSALVRSRAELYFVYC